MVIHDVTVMNVPQPQAKEEKGDGRHCFIDIAARRLEFESTSILLVRKATSYL
jgi:hypothetical protein